MTTHAQAARLVAALLEVEDPKDFLKRLAAKSDTRITLDSNPDDAPGCYKVLAANGEDLLIQTDWDYPGTARTFGWDMTEVQRPNREDDPCEHSNSDGTVDCPCGVTAGQFIDAARQWLDDHDGAQAEDPGYFGEAEDPKDFFKRHLPDIQRAQGIKRVAEYELEDIGIDHQQYFTGRGTAYTNWDSVYVGTGDNPAEAIGDALDSAAQDGWVVDVPAKEAENWQEHPSVSDHIRGLAKEEAEREIKEEDYETPEDYEEAVEEKTEENLEQGEWELSYYAAVYLREPEAGEAPLTHVQEAEDPKDFLLRRLKNPAAPDTWPKVPRWLTWRTWDRDRERTQWRRAFYTVTGSRYKRNPDGSMATEGGFTVPEPYEYQKRLPNTKFWRKIGSAPEHWIDYAGHEILKWDTAGDAIVNVGTWRNSGVKSRLNQFLPNEWRIAAFQGAWWWYNAQWPENIRNRLISDQMARRRPDFPWWIPFGSYNTVKVDGTLVFGDRYGEGWARPDGTVKLPTAQHPIPPPRGVLHPRTHRRNAYDPNQMTLNLEGLYLRRLARWKRIMGKHDRMKEVAKIQREVEDVDKPNKKKKKKEGHERLR